MSTEFNYKRALNEKYYPLFSKFRNEQNELFNTLHKIINSTENFDIQKVILDEEVIEKFNNLTTPIIQETALIVYRCGYYGYDLRKEPFQKKGFYWKFQDTCDQWLIHNGHAPSRILESCFCPEGEFQDHKKGTNYSNLEIENFLNALPERIVHTMSDSVAPVAKFKVVTGNHRVVDKRTCKVVENLKPHVFMITQKHLSLSENGVVTGKEVPCGTCGYDIDEHLHDIYAVLCVYEDTDNEYIKNLIDSAQKAITLHNSVCNDKMLIDDFGIQGKQVCLT